MVTLYVAQYRKRLEKESVGVNEEQLIKVGERLGEAGIILS